jgi:hypothetical protein
MRAPHPYPDLPAITFGVVDDGTTTSVVQPASARYSGTVVVGRSGSGKTGVLDNVCLTDANALDSNGVPVCGVLYLDTHDGPRHIIPRIRPERRKDVYLISLFPDDVPMFPIFGDLQTDDDVNNLASLLGDAWRVQHGTDYVGPRTEEALIYTLLTVSRVNLSPVEVLGTIALREYRKRLLRGRDLRGDDIDLHLYWRGVMASLREDTWALWSHPVFNKLSPLLTNRWLRLATSGTPPLVPDEEAALAVLDEPDLLSVTLLCDGWLGVTRDRHRDRSGHLVTQFVRFTDEFDPWLLEVARGGQVVCSRHPLGLAVDDPSDFQADLWEPGLQPVSAAELAVWGPTLLRYVARRRRRRGFTRFAQLELAARPPYRCSDGADRCVVVRETVCLQDLLDDRKIVMFEIPEFRGRVTAKTLATFALIQALMRGHRQLGLPPDRVVPVSIVGDETALYLSETLEATFRELRKAKVSLTISLVRQRQLAARNTELMRGVMDNVGTRAVLNPAGREAEDFAREFDIPVEDLRGMGTGDAYIDTLDAKGGRGSVRTGPVRCRLAPLPPVEDQVSADIRRRSLDRIYLPRLEAQANFEHRAAFMLAAQGAEPDEPGGLAARKGLYEADGRATGPRAEAALGPPRRRGRAVTRDAE